MELHDLGPVKLFDTAGINEAGELGEKKRKKSLATLKESDVGVLVVDISRHQRLLGQADRLKVCCCEALKGCVTALQGRRYSTCIAALLC